VSFLSAPLSLGGAPWWVWGIGLLSLPILIHLINLLRHRRVKWAAMDFLLQSQKKQRKWIILKQLLLLLARMAVLALIALMLARPLVKDAWGEIFGGGTTLHHVVLLDGSFSMTDRLGDSSAFERGKRVITRLANQANREGGRQRFTLLRFSKAGGTSSEPDLLEQPLDNDFNLQLEKLFEELKPSQTAVGPGEPLDAVRNWLGDNDDETQLVYVVSDFRENEWSDPKQIREQLADLEEAGAKINLVQCVNQTRQNLAITRLAPRFGTRAAGVELLMEVAVKNFGAPGGEQQSPAVAVRLEENGQSRTGIEIDEVAPGEEVVREFRVLFTESGEHTLKASIGGDPVIVDNSRFAVVDLPEQVPALIVDSDPRGRDAYFLAVALNPGGKVKTGLRPQIESPQFLRKHEELAKFPVIYLCNLPRLDTSEIEALENYVRDGGSVIFFMGEQSSYSFFSDQLYRGGEGLFPVPLKVSTELLVDRLEQAPDIQVTDHPIFRTFLNMRNNPLDAVIIERYFQIPTGWEPEADSGVEVIAELRNGEPLVLEKPFGDGRVVAFLTKPSPTETKLGSWNNWARNYSFIPIILSLQAYLSQPGNVDEEHSVGAPIVVQVDSEEYEPQVSFLKPDATAADAVIVDAQPTGESPVASLEDTDESGFYRAMQTTVEGEEQENIYARNVVAQEGNLRMLGPEGLEQQLAGIQYEFLRADDIELAEEQELAGFDLTTSVMGLLILLLLVEQLLGYLTSYHPPKMGARR